MFVLFFFVFRLYAFVEVAALHSIVLRYAGAPIATLVFFFFSLFCLFGDVAFSQYFFVFFVPFIAASSLYGEYVVPVRYFLPNNDV